MFACDMDIKRYKDKDGYKEKVREREGNRDGEWEKEKYTQFGREVSIGKRVGLMLKLDELL